MINDDDDDDDDDEFKLYIQHHFQLHSGANEVLHNNHTLSRNCYLNPIESSHVIAI